MNKEVVVSRKCSAYWLSAGCVRNVLFLLFAFLFSITRVHAQPANDLFDNRTPISGTLPQFYVSNYGFTVEPGEPTHSYLTGDKSVWFAWTATETGPIAISTIDSTIPGNDTLISVYSGSSLTNLTLVAENLVHPPASQFDFPRTDNYVVFDAVAGETYQFSLDGVTEFGGGQGTFSVNIVSPPSNNAFESRAPVFDQEVVSYNFFAQPDPQSGNAFVWWYWTAPASGWKSFSISDSSLPPEEIIVNVYTGFDRASLQPVSLLTIPTAVNGSFSFFAVAGTTYQIAIGSNPKLGFIRLRPGDLKVRPANDDFENRTFLAGSFVTVADSSANATKQPSEPNHGGQHGGASIWYSWTAPTNGTVSLRILQQAADPTLIGVYTGDSLSTLTPVPIASPTNFSMVYGNNRGVTFDAIAGTTYQIALDKASGYGDEWLSMALNFATLHINSPMDGLRILAANSLPLSVACGDAEHDLVQVDYYVGTNWIASSTQAPFDAVWQSPPVGASLLTAVGTTSAGIKKISPPVTVVLTRGNDDFANRTILSGTTVAVSGSTSGASLEPGEQPLAAGLPGHSIWYSWTAPSTGTLQISTDGSSFYTIVGVYTGSTTTNLVCCAVETDNYRHPLNLHVDKGVTYQIAIDGTNPDPVWGTGNVQLHLALKPSPANDNFENARILQGTSLSATNSNRNSSLQPGEFISSDPAATYTLWYCWTAPASTYVRLSTARTAFGTYVAIYTGSTLSTLVPIAPLGSQPDLGFMAQKGVKYYFQVSSEDEGSILLNLNASKVVISSPFSNTTLTGPTNIVIQASVVDLDAPVKRVDFYQGTTLLGSSSTRPFKFVWNNVVGNFSLSAVAIDSKSHSTRSQAVPICILGTNDAFANASRLKGNDVTAKGCLVGFTSESGEPAIRDYSSGSTGWWIWTAATNGVVTISATGSAGNPLMAVYTGSQLSQLSLIASNNYLHYYTDCAKSERRVRNNVSFDVRAGDTYYLLVDNPALTTRDPWRYCTYNSFVRTNDNVSLHLKFASAPKNDEFAHRTLLVGNHLAIAASNIAATKQPGEPNHAGNPGGSSIWYTWKAPASGSAKLTSNIPVPQNSASRASKGNTYPPTFHPSAIIIELPPQPSGPPPEYDLPTPAPFFPVFAVYTGSSLDQLTPIASGLSAAFDVVAGQTYQIAIDGNLGTTGKFIFNLNQNPPPSNDKRANALPITGTSAVVKGSNLGATREAGEPDIAGDSSGHSVWWSWVPPKAGVCYLNTSGSAYEFPMAVFVRDAKGNFNCIAQDAFNLSFNCSPGIRYYIAIGSLNGADGKIQLSLYESSVPIY